MDYRSVNAFLTAITVPASLNFLESLSVSSRVSVDGPLLKETSLRKLCIWDQHPVCFITPCLGGLTHLELYAGYSPNSVVPFEEVLLMVLVSSHYGFKTHVLSEPLPFISGGIRSPCLTFNDLYIFLSPRWLWPISGHLWFSGRQT